MFIPAKVWIELLLEKALPVSDWQIVASLVPNMNFACLTQANAEKKMQELATFIKFCEPTYQRVSFVAEFWNTMSSFAYCVPAIHFWILTERFGRSIPECFTSTTVWRYKLCAACWFILGLGSAAFHSFQTIWAEMWDEIGMLVAILSLSFCLFDLHPLTTSKRASWFYGILILSVFAALLVYIQIMHHPFFVATFLLAAHVPLLLAMTMPINMNRVCVKLFKEKLRGPTRASRAAEDSAKKISRSLSLFGSLSSNRGVFIGILLSVIGYAIWHIDQKCVSDNWKPIYSLPYGMF